MQKKRLRGTSPPGRLAAEQKAQTNGVHLFCRASLTHPALGFPPSDASVLRIFLRLLFFPGVALLSQLLRPWQDFEFDWHPYRLFPCVQQNSNTKKNVCVCATQRGASQSLISFLWIWCYSLQNPYAFHILNVPLQTFWGAAYDIQYIIKSECYR